MALTKIVTGMEKGPEAIDANFAVQQAQLDKVIADTDWLNTGVTYLNGTAKNPYEIKYRIITFSNGAKMGMVKGYIGNFSSKNNTTIAVNGLPAEIVQCLNGYTVGRYVQLYEATMILNVDTSAHTLTINNQTGSDISAKSFLIDLIGVTSPTA